MQIKRLWMILAAVLLACTLFTSCGADDGQPDAGTTEAPETEAPLTGIEIAALNGYRVIRAEKADKQVIDAAVAFCDQLNAVTNTKPMLADDFYREGVPGYSIEKEEILIGGTNREETAAFLAELKAYDYGYAVINGKLVIAGHTAEMTCAALTLFRTEVLDNLSAESKFFVTDNTRSVKKSEYAIDALTLCGKPISEYTIVYDKNDDHNEILAETLTGYVAAKVGYVLPVVGSNALSKVAAEQGVIYIGRSDKAKLPAALSTAPAEGQYLLAADTADRTFVLAAGSRAQDTVEAVKDLMERMTETGEKTVAIDLEGNAPIPVGERDLLSAMSFNVWVSSITDERMQSVLDMIKKYMPDTIGVQEASVRWMDYLKKNLKDTYACVGVGRDAGGAGEHSAIFYAKDKFNLIESDTKWLSATPDVPSKFDESSLNRIYTYAILERKSDGKQFLCINTHLEHTTEDARVLQAGVLLEFIAKYPNLPIVCTGDFNTTRGGALYDTIVDSRLADGAMIAVSADTVGTFHSYGSANKIIDFCFVSDDSVLVDSYHVCDEKINGDYVSDHHPVMIHYQLID